MPNKTEEFGQLPQKTNIISNDKYSKSFEELANLATSISNQSIALILLFKGDIVELITTENCNKTLLSKNNMSCFLKIHESKDPVVIKNPQNDNRFQDFPFVQNFPKLNLYVGFPLINSEGNVYGSLCLIGNDIYPISTNIIDSLLIISKQISNIDELRQSNEVLKSDLNSNILESEQDILLQKSNEMLEMLFQLSPFPKWIYNEKMEILDANDAAIEHYGYSKTEFLKMTLLDIRPKEEINKLLKIREEIQIENGLSHYGTFTHKKKDGTLILVEVSGHNIYYKNQRCKMVLCHDVTKRNKAIIDLIASENKLKVAQKIAKIGYWQLKKDSNILFWTDEVYSIWGVSAENYQPTLEAFLNSIHPEDIDAFNSAQMAALNGKVPLDIKHRIIMHDQSIKWVHEQGQLIHNEQNKKEYFEGTVQDITKEMELNISLKTLNERYEYVLDATSDAIWDWDKKSNELFWGKGFETLFGYNQEGCKMTFDDWKIKVHPNDIDTVLSIIQNVIEENKTNFWESEYRYLKSSGEYCIVYDRGIILRGENGQCHRLIGAMRDITIEKAQNKNKKLLEKINGYFTSIQDFKESILKIVNEINQTFESDFAEIWMKGYGGETFNLYVKSQENDLSKNFYSSQNPKLSFPINECLTGLINKEGKVLIWNELNENIHFKRKELALNAGITSAIGIPLNYGSETIGVLLLFNRKESSICPQNFVFDGLGDFLGSEIHRKRLESDYFNAFNSVPGIICISDTNGKILRHNSMMSNLFELKKSLVGEKITDLIYSADQEKLNNYFSLIGSEPTDENLDIRFVTADGQIKWLSWSSVYSKDEEIIYSVAKDTTNQKELEILVEKAERIGRIGRWEINFINGTIYISPIVRKMLGVDNNFELNFTKLFDFVYNKTDKNLIEEALINAQLYGTPCDLEIELITDRKKIKWIKIVGEVEMVDQRVIKFIGSVIDIDSRKKREFELIKAHDENKAILESFGDAFLAINNENKITYVNSIAEKILNLKGLDLLGKNWHEKFDHKADDELMRLISNNLNILEKANFECYSTKQGLWFELNIYPSIHGKSIYIKDVTERKKIDIKLKDAYEIIVKVEEIERERFAAELHDELSQNLIVLKLYTHMVADNNKFLLEDNHFKMMRKVVDDSITSCKDIINKIQPKALFDFGLEKVIEGMILKINLLGNLTITTSLTNYNDESLTDNMKFQLFRIIQENINNILKHSQAKNANLSLIRHNEKLILEFKDDGIGVDETIINLENSFIAIKRRVLSIDGTFSFKNNPSRGVIFTYYFNI